MEFYWLNCSASHITHKLGFADCEVVWERSGDFGGPVPTCEHCAAEIGSLRWQPPYVVRLSPGKYGDMMSGGATILFSKRFKEAWQTSGLQGISFIEQPVEVAAAFPSAGQRPTYFLATISHTLTTLDEDASGMVIDELVGCDRCRVANRTEVQRLRINEDTWRGEAAFQPSGLFGTVIVSKDFVDLVYRHRYQNFILVHQDDYHEPYMPLRRAVKYLDLPEAE